MRSRRPLFILLLLACVGMPQWTWAEPEQTPVPVTDSSARMVQLEDENKKLRADADFARRRMALLEEEIERLRGVVKTRQEADDQASNHTLRESIEREVEQLRGLRFLHPVDFREIPRTDLPAILRQKLAQQVPDQEFEDAGISLAALGVLPSEIDLKKTYLALLGEQIGAFYDQHEKQLFTFSGQPLSASQNRVIMAHELTHALEDQHFDLSRLPIESKGNDDRVLAATALVEGDATLVMNRYMVGDLSTASIRDALASTLTTDVRQLASAPRYLRETLLFPYLRGQEFCDRLYSGGGWDALAEAFRHPPASSSQILHPERFLAHPREDPMEISLPDAELLGQKPVENNVLGEFGVRQLLLLWLHDEHRASEVAAGWLGDRYIVYRQEKASGYLWKIVCRDEKSAQAMFEAMNACAVGRYHPMNMQEGWPIQNESLHGRPAGKPASDILRYVTAHAGARKIECALTRRNEVFVADAQDERWAKALADQFAPNVWPADEN